MELPYFNERCDHLQELVSGVNSYRIDADRKPLGGRIGPVGSQPTHEKLEVMFAYGTLALYSTSQHKGPCRKT